MDLGQQAQLQQQIRDLLKSQEAIMEKMAEHSCTQAECAKAIAGSVDRGSRSAQRQTQHSRATRDALREMRDIVAQSEENMRNLEESIEDAEEDASSFSDTLKSLAKGGLVVGGLVSVFQKVTGAISGIVSIIGSAVKGIFSLAKAIIMLPIDIISGFIKMAGNRSGGISPVTKALEEITKTFGALTRIALGRKGALGSISKGFRSLTMTGRSLRYVYGPGREGVAAALKDLTKTFEKMGPLQTQVRAEFERTPKALLHFKNGLGLTEDAFKTFASHAVSEGRQIADVLTEVGSTAQQLGEEFGIEVKAMSKDITEMMTDVEHFGHMSKKEMGNTAVFARKLGIEIKDLGGLVDKFLNFEDSAESMALLAAGFGANIDALALTKAAAENPAKAIDLILDGLSAANVQYGNMNAAQRALLKQSTGLEGAQLKQAMAAKEQGLSYEQIAQQGDAANASQKDQGAVLKDLGKQMAKTFGSGARKFDSFQDAFMQGITRGITRSKDFRGALIGISRALREVYRLGIEVGRMFMTEFPGIADIFKGIKEIFRGKAWVNMIGQVRQAFRLFFDMFKDKQTRINAVDTFVSNIGAAFSDFASSGAGGQLWNGLVLFGEAFGELFLQAFEVVGKYALKGVLWVMNKIAWAMNNPGTISSEWSGIMSSFSRIFGDIWNNVAERMSDQFAPVIDQIVEQAKVLKTTFEQEFLEGKDLGEYLEQQFNIAIEHLKSALYDVAIGLGIAFMAWTFGPAVLKFVAMKIMPGIATAISGGLGSAMAAIRGGGGGRAGRAIRGIGRGLGTALKFATKAVPFLAIGWTIFDGIKRATEAKTTQGAILGVGDAIISTLTLGMVDSGMTEFVGAMDRLTETAQQKSQRMVKEAQAKARAEQEKWDAEQDKRKEKDRKEAILKELKHQQSFVLLFKQAGFGAASEVLSSDVFRGASANMAEATSELERLQTALDQANKAWQAGESDLNTWSKLTDDIQGRQVVALQKKQKADKTLSKTGETIIQQAARADQATYENFIGNLTRIDGTLAARVKAAREDYAGSDQASKDAAAKHTAYLIDQTMKAAFGEDAFKEHTKRGRWEAGALLTGRFNDGISQALGRMFRAGVIDEGLVKSLEIEATGALGSDVLTAESRQKILQHLRTKAESFTRDMSPEQLLAFHGFGDLVDPKAAEAAAKKAAAKSGDKLSKKEKKLVDSVKDMKKYIKPGELRTAEDMILRMNQVRQAFTNLKTWAKDLTKFASLAEKWGAQLTAAAAVLGPAGTSLTTVMNFMQTAYDEIFGTQRDWSRVGSGTSLDFVLLSDSVKETARMINSIARPLVRAVKRVDKGIVKDLGTALGAIAEMDAMVQNVLDNAGKIPIQTKVVQLTNALAMRGKKLKISAGSYNVNIYVNFKLGKRSIVKMITENRNTNKPNSEVLVAGDIAGGVNQSGAGITFRKSNPIA